MDGPPAIAITVRNVALHHPMQIKVVMLRVCFKFVSFFSYLMCNVEESM